MSVLFSAELLHRHNQIEDFSLFANKHNPSAKIGNFTMLEPVMRAIGVNFNSKIAFEIINAKPGVMKTLLYELKITLDRIIKQGEQLANSSRQPGTNLQGTEDGGRGLQPKILRVIQSSKPTYDKSMSVAFENSMRVSTYIYMSSLFRYPYLLLAMMM
jgi:hypothetical protein